MNAFVSFEAGAAPSGAIYYYAGRFDSETMPALSGAVKEKLEMSGVSGPLRRKLFSSFVEMAQNILHYGGAPGDGMEGGGKPGAIGLGQEDQSYWIACGNLVLHEQVERIDNRLAALRSMTLADIKAAYRDQLANDEHAANDALSKGAGLGFLTIARDSKQPLECALEYSFVPHAPSSGRFSYFYLKTVI